MPRRIVQMSDEIAALDELERDIRRPPKRKLMIVLPIFVTLIVTVGATAIAWYSYNTGVREGSEGAAPLLKPQGPAKVTPESPGGRTIPHQDKTVFQAIEGARTDTRVERLLPPPEMPAPLPAKKAKPSAPGSSKVRQAERLESSSDEGESNQGEGTNKPIRLTPGAAKSNPPPPSISRTAPPPPAPKDKGSRGATVTMPAPSKPAAMPKPAMAQPKRAPAGKKPSIARATPAGKPMAAPRSGYGVQIASLSSKTKAGDFWDAQIRQHKDLLSDLSLVVQTVTVKGKTFHRVQGGTLESRKAASVLCGALKKRGLGCVVVSFGK